MSRADAVNIYRLYQFFGSIQEYWVVLHIPHNNFIWDNLHNLFPRPTTLAYTGIEDELVGCRTLLSLLLELVVLSLGGIFVLLALKLIKDLLLFALFLFIQVFPS